MRWFALFIPLVIALSLPLLPPRDAAALAPPAKAKAAGVTVFTNATIYTAISDRPIKAGAMMVKGGKIAGLGTQKDMFDVPAGAELIDLKGAVIIPGLVDTHSHIGVWSKPNVPANSDGNEMSGPVQPGVRADRRLQSRRSRHPHGASPAASRPPTSCPAPATSSAARRST